MRTYELPNIGDNRKSFYGKAIVKEDENGKHLLSYGSNICTIDNDGKVILHTEVNKWDSNTSLRHIKSFLAFFNKETGNKANLIKLYGGR